MSEPAMQIEMPARADAIDRAHLSRVTFGDASLERELLELFDRQCEILLARMHAAEADALKALAHTLKGSASGIGAWGVKEAASTVELSAATPARESAMRQLAAAVADARASATALLRAALA